LIVDTATAVISISPGHAQTDLDHADSDHAAIRDGADVGSLAARVNADAIPPICGNIKAARLTFTPHPCALLHGARNLRVQPVTGWSGAPKVGDICHRKRVDPGITVTPVFATFRPTSEFFAAIKTSDDAATPFSNAMRVIVRTGTDFTSFERRVRCTLRKFLQSDPERSLRRNTAGRDRTTGRDPTGYRGGTR
jgi:hypothetical protein